MKGNESAAEKINAAIRAEIDAFLADTSVRDVVREDYCVYLSNEALSSEYGFSSYYADLQEMGFQQEYIYQENLTIKLQTEEICFFDLNGNGQEEEIQFYIDKQGSAGTNLHFIIDGTDYALEHTELSGQFSDKDYIFCWTQCFLYDMDTTDDMTEIAFQMNYTKGEGNSLIPYTFLYRYEKEGTLTYLGKMEGTVTNPDCEIQFD
ncbi:MAG: hypothetical protein HDQ99_11700 [Lachnospiraceae bacterium]|nr:hypothetical protein [Lachnospiraceae bacterium]